jgi:hypothetical protein
MTRTYGTDERGAHGCGWLRVKRRSGTIKTAEGRSNRFMRALQGLDQGFADARHGRFKPGIQEDVALRRGDEKRTDAGRADVMDVADEAKRLERRVPRLPFPLDRRVFGDVLFGQGRFGLRELGNETGE